MALHPFHTFRKHQKVIFAILTIVCMFVFVLQFGKGDVFTWMAEKFGGRKRSDEVARVFGEKVTAADMEKLRRNRLMANEFMQNGVVSSIRSSMRDWLDPKFLLRFDPADQADLRQAVQTMNQPIMLLFSPPEERYNTRNRLRALHDRLMSQGKADEARAVQDLLAGLSYVAWMVEQGRGQSLYFGGSATPEGLLDFVMWRHLADKLGIKLTDDDIRREINRDLLNRDALTGDAKHDVERIHSLLREGLRQLSLDDFYAALGDELRVSMAQAAMLGMAPGARNVQNQDYDVNQIPAVATPDEFWKFYQDNRTALRVAMLPIKVDSFLEQSPPAKDAPDKELKDLYNRYKDQEPSPDRPQPGFKVGRRVKVEWVGGRGDSPYYRQQAVQAVKVSDALLQFGAVNPQASWAAAATGLALPARVDLRVVSAYDSYLLGYPSWYPSYIESNRLHDNSITRADVAAATLGQLAGGSSLAGASTFLASAVAREHRTRTQLLATTFLAGTNPSPLAALALPAALTPRPLPLDTLRPQLLARVYEGFAPRLLMGSLNTIQEEMKKLKGQAKEIDGYVQKAIKEYHLEHGAMSQAKDRFALPDDPSLAKLREAEQGSGGRSEQSDRRFADRIFQGSELFTPQQTFGVGEDQFVFWKTADEPAYVPTYEEARPRIVEAWRMRHARELAYEAAKRVLAAVKAQKVPDEAVKVLRDERAKHPGWGDVYVPPEPIARLVLPKAPVIRPSQDYEPFRAPEDLRLRPDFADQLLKTLKASGDVTLVPNLPDTVYYVTVAQDVLRPTEKEFADIYARSALPRGNPERNNLWELMEQERRQKHLQAAVEELRNEAGAENGRWKLPEDFRKRGDSGGRGGGGEDEE